MDRPDGVSKISCGLAWVATTYTTSPEEANLEQDQTCYKQRGTNIVEHLRLLSLSPNTMLHAEGRRVVEQEIQRARDDVECN